MNLSGDLFLQSRSQTDEDKSGSECNERSGISTQLRKTLVSVNAHDLESTESSSRFAGNSRFRPDECNSRALLKQGENERSDKIGRTPFDTMPRPRERHLEEGSVDPDEVDLREFVPISMEKRVMVEPGDDFSGVHHLLGAAFEGRDVLRDDHVFSMSQIRDRFVPSCVTYCNGNVPVPGPRM